MADKDACFSCGNDERPDLPPRERIYVGQVHDRADLTDKAVPVGLGALARS